jgi:hypothetical protein
MKQAEINLVSCQLQALQTHADASVKHRHLKSF